MKNFRKILLLFPLLALFANCEDGDVFTGSPLDDANQKIETLNAELSTTTTLALTDQKIPFTVKLPQTFTDTVRVEATALSDSGRRRRAYVEILPNTNTATGDILAAGGDIYSTTFTLTLTAIEFYNGVKGTHYLLKSNVLNINTGNTSVPDNDLARLQIKFAYPNASTSTNRLRMIVQRPNGIANATVNLLGGALFHYISNVNAPTITSSSQGTINTSNATTTIPAGGEFILTVSALGLVESPTDLPYRIIVNFPNDTVQVFEGVLTGIVVGSPYIPVAKVTKIVDGSGNITYTAEAL